MTAPPGTYGNPAPATIPDTDSGRNNWLNFRHPDYLCCRDMWEFAMDFYSGDILMADKLPRYLIRRSSGEPIKAYNERKKLADYENHYATIIDSLAGILYASDEDTARGFHPADDPTGGLGDPKDQKTVAGRLTLDADGMGCGWETLHKQLASLLCITGGGRAPAAWGLVTSPSGSARVQYLSPLDVCDWVYGPDGQLIEVKVRELAVIRESVRSKPVVTEQYVLYETTGWKRYRKSQDGKDAVELTGPGNSGGYTFTDREGLPALPIYPVRVPLRRMVGWLLAKNASAIFNLESARDFLLFMAHFPKLILAAGDDFFETLSAMLEEGANVLQEDPVASGDHEHRYIGPPTEAAKLLSEVLDKRVVDLYIKGFREYGDAAREVTATEARQKVAAGVGAFLQMLAAALDDAENNALWRIAQIEFPSDAARHFTAKVERSKEFMPADVQAVVDRLVVRYFGKDTPVPVGRKGQAAIAAQVAEYEGLDVSAAEIQQAVDLQNLKAQLETFRELPASATLKVQLALKAAEVLGIIPPEAAPDGTMPEPDKKLRTVIEAELTRAAESEALAAARLAELNPGGDPGGDPNAPPAGDPNQPPKPAGRKKPPTPRRRKPPAAPEPAGAGA